MKKTESVKARDLRIGLMVYLAPKLAQDAKIDLNPIVAGIDEKNFADKKAGIATAVKDAVKDKLAKDASVEDVIGMLDAIGGEKGADAYDAPGGNKEALCTFLKGKLSPEDYAQVEKLLGGAATDTSTGLPKPGGAMDKKDQPEGSEKIDKSAMDAAIKEATDKATKDAAEAARKEQKAIRDAERAVRPYVGELAMDSIETAADVYRAAFKVLNVDVKDVHESAFPALLKAQKPAKKTETANDSNPGVKSFDERFNTARLGA